MTENLSKYSLGLRCVKIVDDSQVVVLETQKNCIEAVVGIFKGPSRELNAMMAAEAPELLALCDAMVVRLEHLIVFYEDVEDFEAARKATFLLDRLQEVLLRFENQESS